MAGWSTVVRLPFVPRRAIEEFHLNVAHRENLISLVLFFLLSTSFYALYSAHLVWTRLPGGKFLFGLVVLASAICLNNFIYVLVADIFSDSKQKQTESRNGETECTPNSSDQRNGGPDPAK